MGFRRAQPEGSPRISQTKRVLWIVLGLNLAVALAKIFYGMVTGSVAMQADGFHSIFDGTSNLVGLVGIAAASRPADGCHPYGHGKYETYASAMIGALLLGAAWKVGSAAVARFSDGGAPPRVDLTSFLIMAGTLVVNIAVTSYERRRGRALKSEILIADASHTTSDILVSLGVIAGLAAVRLGFPLADPIIALGVAAMILWTAWQVLQQASETLSDRARLPVPDVCGAVLQVPGVLGCHSVRTRGSASEVCVDLHIQVDPSLTVADGHRTAEAVERAVSEAFDEVADVIVHLEPMDDYQAAKTAGENGRLTG